MTKLNRMRTLVAAACVTSVGLVAGMVGIASATPYDPTSDLTTLASNTGSSLGPVVVAVATALIGIVILFWGVKFVYGLIDKRHGRVA